MIVKMGGIDQTFRLNFHESMEQPHLRIKDPVALNDITRLYYGLRCVYAHGGNLEKHQILKDFPEESDLSNSLGDQQKKIAKRLCGLYSCIAEHGRSARINYLHLVNLQRYLMVLALRLFQAIRRAIYDMFGQRLWGYDPSRDQSRSEELDISCLFNDDADTEDEI